MDNTTAGRVLQEHPAIVDLIKILERHDQGAAGELAELANHFSGLEELLHKANQELRTMRRELTELREQHGEPLHNVAQQEHRAMSKSLAEVGERLGAVKEWLISGAQDAAAAFREKGVDAMAKAVSFLGIRKELEHICKDAQANIALRDMSINQIQKVSRQYHETGTAVRNLGRIMIGRETQDDTKAVGKLAELAMAPHKAIKAMNAGMVVYARAALHKLGQLEDRASAQKESLLGRLDEHRKENAGAPKKEDAHSFQKLQDSIKAYDAGR